MGNFKDRFFRRIAVYLKALLNGAWRHLQKPSESNLDDYDPEISEYPDRTIVALLKWINRNRVLMDLIGLGQRHVLRVIMAEGAVRVNCYLATEGSGKAVEAREMLDGIYTFTQKSWEDAIGADYTPFMVPIRNNAERIYYDPIPLFSFSFRIVRLTETENEFETA